MATAKKTKHDKKKELVEELTALLDELDEAGLEFLLEQGRVHRYNMEVERLNAIEERRGTRGATGAAAERSAASTLSIERSEDGNTYHIVANGKWKLFAAEEMARLVGIAWLAEPEEDRARGLFAWLSTERADALGDLGIAKPSSPRLAELVRLLRASFAKPKTRR